MNNTEEQSFAKGKELKRTGKKRPSVVSFFAGCGGLDLGFVQAGFDVVWANEYDSAIWETYSL